jgi:hypothetical protein
MPPLRRKKSRKVAHATILFTSAKNEDGDRQICVYAQCQMSENTAGPIWGHTDQSIRKSLSVLTRHCDCPARFHKPREYQGKRILPKTQK